MNLKTFKDDAFLTRNFENIPHYGLDLPFFIPKIILFFIRVVHKIVRWH